MKAADISEIEVLRFIDRMSLDVEPRESGTERWQQIGGLYRLAKNTYIEPRWVFVWDFEQAEEWKDIPWKLMKAKLSRMMRKGLITGCLCGCRGDFELTEKGDEVLKGATNGSGRVDTVDASRTP